MDESQIENDVREYWKAERRLLPVSAAIALAVCLAVWTWRLDRLEEPLPFLSGVLVGALVMAVLYAFVNMINLAAMLGGVPRGSSLLKKVRWLARAK